MFTCNVCGSTAAKVEFVSEVFTTDDRCVRVEHIPAEICERCGEATFSRETAEKIRHLVHEVPLSKTAPLDLFALAEVKQLGFRLTSRLPCSSN